MIEDSHFECEWGCVCYTSGGQLFQSVTPEANKSLFQCLTICPPASINFEIKGWINQFVS